jgi:spore germination protein YaaH
LLIPEGLQCISADGRLDISQDAKLFDWMKSAGTEIPVMTLLQNSDGTVWHTAEMALMLAHPAARKNLETSIFNFVVAQHQPGVVLDFEEVPEKSQDDFRTFIGELAAQLHTQTLKLMVALPAADWSYDYKTIAQHADAIILMNYDQHWVTSEPGPITRRKTGIFTI